MSKYRIVQVNVDAYIIQEYFDSILKIIGKEGYWSTLGSGFGLDCPLFIATRYVNLEKAQEQVEQLIAKDRYIKQETFKVIKTYENNSDVQ